MFSQSQFSKPTMRVFNITECSLGTSRGKLSAAGPSANVGVSKKHNKPYGVHPNPLAQSRVLRGQVSISRTRDGTAISFDATSWACELELPAHQKLVLVMLCHRLNDETGRCDPGLARVGQDCGLSKSAVKRALRQLTDAKLVIPVQRKDDTTNLSNTYHIHTWQTALVCSIRPEVGPDRPQDGAEETLGVGPNRPLNKATKQRRQQVSTLALTAPAVYALQSFISLPLNDASLFPITEQRVAEWRDLFPVIDVEQELRSYRAHFDAQPAKRKTKSGILKSVVFWLSQSQNRGKNYTGGNSNVHNCNQAKTDGITDSAARAFALIAGGARSAG